MFFFYESGYATCVSKHESVSTHVAMYMYTIFFENMILFSKIQKKNSKKEGYHYNIYTQEMVGYTKYKTNKKRIPKRNTQIRVLVQKDDK